MIEYLVVYEDKEEYEDHGFINLGIFGSKQNAINWVLKLIKNKYPNFELKKGYPTLWVPKDDIRSWEKIHIDEIERLD